MPGHGAFIQRLPLKYPCSSFSVTSLPLSSTNTGCTPGIGRVSQQGLEGVTPARFEIRQAPVSVCHQVSMIGHLFLPMFSSYQCQASSLMGSPTVPKVLSDERSLPFIGST